MWPSWICPSCASSVSESHAAAEVVKHVWSHTAVQAPLKSSSPLSIILDITNVKTPLCIASVGLLIMASGVYTGIYTGSYSLTQMFTYAYSLRQPLIGRFDQVTGSTKTNPCTHRHKWGLRVRLQTRFEFDSMQRHCYLPSLSCFAATSQQRGWGETMQASRPTLLVLSWHFKPCCHVNRSMNMCVGVCVCWGGV